MSDFGQVVRTKGKLPYIGNIYAQSLEIHEVSYRKHQNNVDHDLNLQGDHNKGYVGKKIRFSAPEFVSKSKGIVLQRY